MPSSSTTCSALDLLTSWLVGLLTCCGFVVAVVVVVVDAVVLVEGLRN